MDAHRVGWLLLVAMIAACTIIHVPGDDAEIKVEIDKAVDVTAPGEAATVDGSAEDEPEDKKPED